MPCGRRLRITAAFTEIGSELRQHWNNDDIFAITDVIALFGHLNRWNDSTSTAEACL